ncbi:MAG: GNAT family N-acetyltransferase [Defluviitaleaceae bacterium]|nr:GNAT family N-acetyltransferase [Defluviitaleaceae bacterium]
MKSIETARLILRKFKEDDFEAVHSYASSAENTTYMLFGPNDDEDTRAFIKRSIASTSKDNITNYSFAVVLKETGNLIGACDLHMEGHTPEVGWLVHIDYWGKGYATEMGRALLKLGFEEHNLRRIIARCDVENVGSSRVMEKLGMRREGLFREYRRTRPGSGKLYRDELCYAILKEEWDVLKEVDYYNTLPCKFDGFITVPTLSDGELFLVCTEKYPGDTEKDYVPAYIFAVCKGGEQVGKVSLRLDYNHKLYYYGQVGYNIDEAHRGKGYATRACQLMAPVAKAHGMEKLLITNNVTNTASARVCEKLNARLVRMIRLPEWTSLYQEGQRYVNIYEWSIT